MTASLPTDATFAGYRLLRTLGSGSRAQVFLATGPSGAVALKVFSAQVGRDDAGTELDALGRVESPHLVRLLDVAGRGDEVPSLALEPVRRGSVAALLRDRVELERGEVVTLVAPIARLVTQLQRAGVAHGAIGAASVHLGDEGVPVLLGLGHARLFAAGLTPAALDDQPAAASDRRALGAFARTLIESGLNAMNAPFIMTKTGKEAWEMLESISDKAISEGKTVRDKVALVLTDLEMPEMDGFTLTRKIKKDERFKMIPVVIHSSLTGSTNEDHVKNVGADAYVAKFVAEELASTIRKVLSR